MLLRPLNRSPRPTCAGLILFSFIHINPLSIKYLTFILEKCKINYLYFLLQTIFGGLGVEFDFLKMYLFLHFLVGYCFGSFALWFIRVGVCRKITRWGHVCKPLPGHLKSNSIDEELPHHIFACALNRALACVLVCMSEGMGKLMHLK